MSYVALYRTYRPKYFSEVFGQRVIVKTLQNALKHDKFGHAYLFSGPRGTGKTTIAKIVAKALNCKSAPTNEPCGKCDICLGIDKGDVSDVIEIDAASNNGVDEIRDLRDKVKYTPSVGKYKVYIIDEVHMLTTGAFNALLKTLEEPPKYVVFILATTEIHKIPATIISRCQRFDFKNIEIQDIEENLKGIVEKESLQIDEAAIHAIAVNAEGGMRDALSLLDQVVSFTDGKITEEEIFKVSGGLSRNFINALLGAVKEKQTQEALKILNQVLSDGKDMNRVVADLILALRDTLLDKIGKDVKYPELKDLTHQRIYAYLDILNNLQQEMKWTTQKRAYLELGIIKMINHETIDQADLKYQVEVLTQTIETLSKQVKEVKSKPAFTQTIEKPKAKGKPLVTIKQVEDILNSGDREKKSRLKSAWTSLRNYDSMGLKMTAQLLSEGSLEAINEDMMLLVYDDLVTAQAMLKKETKDKVLQILNNKQQLIKDYVAIIKPDWILIKEEYAAKYNAGHSKPKLDARDLRLYEQEVVKEEVKSDDLVDMAIDYFGKDLVKVEE